MKLELTTYIIAEPTQINLPICGFADSWMTKASETPTYNFKTLIKLLKWLSYNIENATFCKSNTEKSFYIFTFEWRNEFIIIFEWK